MQVQVNHDSHVDADDETVQHAAATVTEALSRFEDRLTRVQVHLGDENANKGGADDKRCTIEARPIGQDLVAVTNHADELAPALRGAIEKLVHLLDSHFGRLDHKKGGETIRHEEA